MNLAPYIEKKLISVQEHPLSRNIVIYNYTQKCQFSRAWDEVTTKCRGLIVDLSQNKLLANPFPKFFNYGEFEVNLPAEQPVITKKYDGSLGISYFLPGDRNMSIATRGSFDSDQAIWANKWVKKNLFGSNLNRKWTYLYEIVYPENRIVVNYDFSGLVLLAIRDIETGEELDFRSNPSIIPTLATSPEGYGGNPGDIMRVAESVPAVSLEALKGLNRQNEEGFVVRYSNGLRLKIKFDDYVRLHRLVTGVSEKAIWELMRDGKDLSELLDKVPDEFYKWVTDTVNQIRWREKKLRDVAQKSFNSLDKSLPRKDLADQIKTMETPQLVFALLDGKDISPMIWRMVKPKVEQKTFKHDIDS